jgi:hypothetical protein
MKTKLKKFGLLTAAFALALAVMSPKTAPAQDRDDDDPPGRVARLGYLEGSVSLQPAGENQWVGAVPNRPLSTGDQLWTDHDSRAEVQLGSAVVRLAPNTGFSFLNLNDNTVQIQLSSGAINVTVRRLTDNDDFEIDTPNQAYTIFQPGHYRIEASNDGSYTIISVRSGDGEATGAGQDYEIRGGQRATLRGTDQLYADIEPLYDEDDFDRWSESRDHRHDYSRSSQYLAPDVVGYDDLDDNGDWRDTPEYGHVWFPNRVGPGWAPYRDGHWDWISPWGWTWVDDQPWGYAPFHYGRWVNVYGRWGWVAGPPAVRPVYAPALVVFVGGSPGGGGNVGWFPLGPREVYVPSYHVSPAYVNRVNVSNTTVNVTQVTNVYNTTIINKTTNVTNVTYVNRSVQGAVTAVPQRAFVSAQPVQGVAVTMNAKEIAAAPLSTRVAVAPTRESVLGAKASTAGRVTAPPPAIASRQVVAKATPPPPPVPFAKQQQALAAHPGQPLARSEVQNLRPAATAAAARPMVRVAPPAKPATPTTGHPAAPPANAARPGQPNQPAAAQPTNQPATRPQPNQPRTNQPQPNQSQPAQPNNRTQPAQPENRPQPPVNRLPAAQPENRPAPAPPANRPPAASQPENRPQPNRNQQPTPTRQAPPPNERPQQQPAQPQRTPPPAEARPGQPAPRQQPKPLTPEEKKKQEEQKKQ